MDICFSLQAERVKVSSASICGVHLRGHIHRRINRSCLSFFMRVLLCDKMCPDIIIIRSSGLVSEIALRS